VIISWGCPENTTFRSPLTQGSSMGVYTCTHARCKPHRPPGAGLAADAALAHAGKYCAVTPAKQAAHASCAEFDCTAHSRAPGLSLPGALLLLACLRLGILLRVTLRSTCNLPRFALTFFTTHCVAYNIATTNALFCAPAICDAPACFCLPLLHPAYRIRFVRFTHAAVPRSPAYFMRARCCAPYSALPLLAHAPVSGVIRRAARTARASSLLLVEHRYVVVPV